MRKLYCKFNLFILRVPAIGTSDSKKINVLTPFNLKEKGVEGVSYQLAVAVEGAGGREEDDGTVLLLRQPKAPRVEGQDCVEARVGDGLEVGSNEEPSALL